MEWKLPAAAAAADNDDDVYAYNFVIKITFCLVDGLKQLRLELNNIAKRQETWIDQKRKRPEQNMESQIYRMSNVSIYKNDENCRSERPIVILQTHLHFHFILSKRF